MKNVKIRTNRERTAQNVELASCSAHLKKLISTKIHANTIWSDPIMDEMTRGSGSWLLCVVRLPKNNLAIDLAVNCQLKRRNALKIKLTSTTYGEEENYNCMDIRHAETRLYKNSQRKQKRSVQTDNLELLIEVTSKTRLQANLPMVWQPNMCQRSACFDGLF